MVIYKAIPNDFRFQRMSTIEAKFTKINVAKKKKNVRSDRLDM